MNHLQIDLIFVACDLFKSPEIFESCKNIDGNFLNLGFFLMTKLAELMRKSGNET